MHSHATAFITEACDLHAEYERTLENQKRNDGIALFTESSLRLHAYYELLGSSYCSCLKDDMPTIISLNAVTHIRIIKVFNDA